MLYATQSWSTLSKVIHCTLKAGPFLVIYKFMSVILNFPVYLNTCLPQAEIHMGQLLCLELDFWVGKFFSPIVCSNFNLYHTILGFSPLKRLSCLELDFWVGKFFSPIVCSNFNLYHTILGFSPLKRAAYWKHRGKEEKTPVPTLSKTEIINLSTLATNMLSANAIPSIGTSPKFCPLVRSWH